MNLVRASLASASASIALLAGCASPITHEPMVPQSFDVMHRHPQTVGLQVSGGKETDAMDKPQISDDAFRQALAEAITRSKTFSSVVQGSGGDYLLTVAMISLDQPSFGLTFTVRMEAAWTLRRAGGGPAVWQEAVRSEFTATTSDSLAAITRLKLATEGAARENIAQGVAKLSKLNL